MKKTIFIAATGQNVGKTTLCLGILSGLRKRIPSVGFLKPVGQQHIISHEGTEVDKDVILFKDHFHLSPSYASMSPVICPHGFTKDFLDHKVTEVALLQKIEESYRKLSTENDFVLVEGTGHIGVGSIFHLNNAKVAKHLGLDVVIVAIGGLGSSYDELALNINMCRSYGVRVRGIILNKVQENKRDMILEYFPKSLETSGIPLLGCIPYDPLLTMPTMQDYEHLFRTKLLSGTEHSVRHFTKTCLVAGSLESYHEEKGQNQLVITPACREDIIKATLCDAIDGGMILTGKKPPAEHIMKAIQQSSLPILYVPLCCFDAMKAITSFTAKIHNEDSQKVERAIQLVETNLNYDLLLRDCI